MNPHIFRAYDVRGQVGLDITPEVFRLVGRAYGSLICRKGGRTIALGRDNRLSSGDLQAAFAEGVLATGVSIVDLGLSPTPVLYFATAHWTLDGGANVTGSHNPIDYNGVKMVHAGAIPLFEEEIQGLRATIEAERFECGSGSVKSADPREEYMAAIQRRVKLHRRLKVVVDAGNGVAGLYAPALLRRLGCDVVELYCELDGRFPHHLPDPEMEANIVDLQKSVVQHQADIGLAFDGDGDRLGVVDERGEHPEADILLAILARDFLSRHPGKPVLLDVKCSQRVIDDIQNHGGVPFLWKTGHALIKRKMREEGILLGGEISGHMFFAEDYYGFDDALMAACRLLSIVSRSERSLSQILDDFPKSYATPELRAPCPDEEKFQVVEEVARYFREGYSSITIDGIRITFDDGWALIRASNTNPYLTLRFEASSQETLERIKELVFSKLKEFPSVQLP